MASNRHHHFRSFLTERFTSVAVDVFREVESLVESYYEENKRLRNILHMVVSPEIKLPRIDDVQHTGITARVGHGPSEQTRGVSVALPTPLSINPKEEQIEHDICWGSTKQQFVEEADNLIVSDWVKNDPDAEDVNVQSTDWYPVEVMEVHQDSSVIAAAKDGNNDDDPVSSQDSDVLTDYQQLSMSEENSSESVEFQTHNKTKKKQSSSDYEAKRKRKFLPDWKKSYSFIEYDETAQLMYCKTCRSCPAQAMGNSLFHGVTGEKVRIRSIKDHAATTLHKSAEDALKVRLNPERGALVSALDRMDVAIKEKMIKLFNIAYFVAKEEAAFTMFPKLVNLHQTNGLDLGTTYSNDQACRMFIEAIGLCFIEDLQEKLRSAKFFSIMSDSSVDRSVKDQELIYCTYLEDGKPVNKLIQLTALDHAHSQGILDAILAGLLKVGVGEEDLKKRLVGFGCDGGADGNNGVIDRLQRLCPSLVPIWCVAHRLELAALDCVKEIPQLKEIRQTLRAIHKHYTCSAKASRELQEIAKAMEISIVRPGNIEGTRWLPHMSHALEALMRNYRPILVHFENHASDPNDREASAAMKGRAKLVQQSLKQFSMLLFIHLMLDVLHELKQLSLLFQQEGLTLQMATDGLQTTSLALVAMQTNPGPRLYKFMEEVGAGSTWQGVQICRSNTAYDTFNTLKLSLTNNFCEFVSERFKSLETGVLKATSTLFDLSNWPENTTDLATFGTAELNVFMEHFHPLLVACEDFKSMEAARREWLDLKILVPRCYRHLNSQVLWQRLIQGAIGKEGQFQHMQVVAEIGLVLPMSSSCCERGFSSMKRIKSDWKSCRSNEMLNSLLQISVHGPPAQHYDSVKAVTKWWSSGFRARRPTYKD